MHAHISMKVAVVKYNAGNIFSVVHALQRLGVEPLLTDCAEQLRSADKVIFPGQGEASGAMRYLRERGLDKVITSLTQPVLGICIGQQLMCRHSEEGDVDCLGIFDVDVKRFRPVRHEDKIPHMGWNSLSPGFPLPMSESTSPAVASPLFKSLPQRGSREGAPFVYFVHSYYVPVCKETIAVADYIHPFSAAMQRDNFYATQFHPEKSGAVGQQILKNFLQL